MGCFEVLVAYSYPRAPFEELRTLCDFVNTIFVVRTDLAFDENTILIHCYQLDEVSDKQNGTDAQRTGDLFLNALSKPDTSDESEISSMAKEYVRHQNEIVSSPDFISYRGLLECAHASCAHAARGPSHVS